MSAPPSSSGEPITDRHQLAAWFEAGSKPQAAWRIGTEHEKFAFRLADRRPLPYDGADGIRAMLDRLVRDFAWEPILEGEHLIALIKDQASITLEPGGQFELSGAPLETVHQTCAEVGQHLRQVKTIGQELGTGMIGLGFQPKWARDQIPWMPKGRYRIMADYMPKRGSLGLDMMVRTCTVQVNLDYADEADMVRKFRVSLALQPLATALFACSPFTEGRPNGFQSFRSQVWTDTDPDRCGDLPLVFEEGFGFERYVDYALDVPMYFVYRQGRYLDASGQSFRDFMAGKLPALPGERPLLTDWSDHLTTLFPEVRLKRFLEMRGADAGPWRNLCALPALWVGLLYDGQALSQAEALVADWTAEERAALRREVPRQGLATPWRGSTLQVLAQEVLALAHGGLVRRARADHCGASEAGFLAPLESVAESGQTLADQLLALYHGRWGQSVDPVFQEFCY